MEYKHAVIGGTFDHLHRGHMSELKLASSIAPKLTVGLTSDAMAHKKVASVAMQPYDVRRRELIQVFATHFPKVSATIVMIDDIYGPAGHEESFDVLVATKTTYENAKRVNEKRQENNVGELKILLAEEILAEDGVLISSTRIRAGEIDREGAVYINHFESTKTLPPSLRAALQQPMGQLFEGPEHDISQAANKCKAHIQSTEYAQIIAIGDIVFKALESVKMKVDVAVVDYRTKRQPLEFLSDRIHSDVSNKASQIESPAVAYLQKVIQTSTQDKPGRMVVEGEEDLLVLPSVMLAPLGSWVCYGQPEVGMVAVEVTEQSKAAAKALVAQFQ